MKIRTPGLRTIAQLVASTIALAALAACGNGGDGTPTAQTTQPAQTQYRVISFGDSLSDVGTYAPLASQLGGGEYTTNSSGALLWNQVVAKAYNTSLTPAYTSGWNPGGTPPAPIDTQGYGYAQGGAMVYNQNPTEQALGVSGWSVDQQLTAFLSSHGNFNQNDIVLVQGGANDIFNAAAETAAIEGAVFTYVETSGKTTFSATDPQLVAAIEGAINTLSTNGSGDEKIIAAAHSLAQEVIEMIQHGASHVAVMTMPDLGATPYAQQADEQLNQVFATVMAAKRQALAAQAQAPTLPTPVANPSAPAITNPVEATMSAVAYAFNQTLLNDLASYQAAGQVIVIDAYTTLDQQVTAFQSAGGSVHWYDTACAQNYIGAELDQAVPGLLGTTENGTTDGIAEGLTASAWSLFCSPQALVTPAAATTYLFADDVHPTQKLHQAFGDYAVQQLQAAGLKTTQQ